MANELTAQEQQQHITTLSSYFNTRKQSLAAILPKHMTAERICRIVLSAASRTPKLLECTPESVYLACHSAAQLGLEPGGPLGHAYLVPFFNNKAGCMECQYIPGYKGLIDLARRSGHISTVYAYTVHKDDKFEFELGLEPRLVHVPSLTTPPTKANMTHVYACAHLTDGGRQFVVLTAPEVEGIRGRSKAKESGPWVTDYLEMAKKTAVKRLVKMLPMSIELADAITHEDQVEYGDLKDVTPEPLRRPQAKSPESPVQSQQAPASQSESAPAPGQNDAGATEPDDGLGDGTPPAVNVVSVTSKDGMSKKKNDKGETVEKKWTKFTIEFSDGCKCGTFDTALSDYATKAKAENRPVHYTAHETSYGLDLDSMQ